MNTKLVPLAVLAAGAGLVGTAPAFAQQDDTLIEEITVTAAKREQSIYEVPIAISAFQGDALAKQGITDIVDIGKFVPNLNITQFSAGHTSSSNPWHRPAGPPDYHRPGGQRLCGRRVPRPSGRPELESVEHRTCRGVTWTAGHAVRTQLDRRRHQHHHQNAGLGPGRACRFRIRQPRSLKRRFLR